MLLPVIVNRQMQILQDHWNFAFWETQGEVLSPKVKVLSNLTCKVHRGISNYNSCAHLYIMHAKMVRIKSYKSNLDATVLLQNLCQVFVCQGRTQEPYFLCATKPVVIKSGTCSFRFVCTCNHT